MELFKEEDRIKKVIALIRRKKAVTQDPDFTLNYQESLATKKRKYRKAAKLLTSHRASQCSKSKNLLKKSSKKNRSNFEVFPILGNGSSYPDIDSHKATPDPSCLIPEPDYQPLNPSICLDMDHDSDSDGNNALISTPPLSSQKLSVVKIFSLPNKQTDPEISKSLETDEDVDVTSLWPTSLSLQNYSKKPNGFNKCETQSSIFFPSVAATQIMSKAKMSNNRRLRQTLLSLVPSKKEANISTSQSIKCEDVSTQSSLMHKKLIVKLVPLPEETYTSHKEDHDLNETDDDSIICLSPSQPSPLKTPSLTPKTSNLKEINAVLSSMLPMSQKIVSNKRKESAFLDEIQRLSLILDSEELESNVSPQKENENSTISSTKENQSNVKTVTKNVLQEILREHPKARKLLEHARSNASRTPEKTKKSKVKVVTFKRSQIESQKLPQTKKFHSFVNKLCKIAKVLNPHQPDSVVKSILPNLQVNSNSPVKSPENVKIISPSKKMSNPEVQDIEAIKHCCHNYIESKPFAASPLKSKEISTSRNIKRPSIKFEDPCYDYDNSIIRNESANETKISPSCDIQSSTVYTWEEIQKQCDKHESDMLSEFIGSKFNKISNRSLRNETKLNLKKIVCEAFNQQLRMDTSKSSGESCSSLKTASIRLRHKSA